MLKNVADPNQNVNKGSKLLDCYHARNYYEIDSSGLHSVISHFIHPLTSRFSNWINQISYNIIPVGLITISYGCVCKCVFL